MLRFEHIRKEYPDVVPLKDINGEIKDGETVAIIGPSGTGKSTFIRMINGLETPTSGKIFYNDIEITSDECDMQKVRRKIGMIFQSSNLFNHLTVLENLVIPQMDILGIKKKAAVENAKYLLKKVGLLHTANKMPDQLSGGQRQRVGIVRALAMKPEVILFDEPTSALDPTMVAEVENVIRMLRDEGGCTMIIVTHDLKFAADIASRIFYIDEGEIFEEGTPEEIFKHPKRSRTKAFIENARILDVEITKSSFDNAYSTIEGFCKTQRISKARKETLVTVVDELIGDVILDENETEAVRFSVFFDKARDALDCKLKYGGEEFNPFEGDDMQVKMLEEHLSEISYMRVSDGEKNSIKFMIH